MEAKEIRDLLEMTKCRIEGLMTLLDDGKVIAHEYERVLRLVTSLRSYLNGAEVRRFFGVGGEEPSTYKFTRKHKVATKDNPSRAGRVIYASYFGYKPQQVVVKWDDDGATQCFDEPGKKLINIE